MCAHFRRLTDGRKSRGKRYGLVLLLVLMVLAKLSGHDTPEVMADWAKQHREQVFKLECQTLTKKTGMLTHSTTYGVTSLDATEA